MTTFKYIDVPKKIDLSKKLMPQRAEEDDWFWGIDPAWLGETLCVLNKLAGNNLPSAEEMSGSKVKMPAYPAMAWYHNWLRSLIFYIWADNYDTPRYWLEYMPTQTTFDSPNNLPYVEFTDVPSYVNVGDPLRKSDIMELYDWMKQLKAIRKTAWASGSDFNMAFATTHDQEGTGDWHTFPDPSNTHIYRWSWNYVESVGGVWGNQLAGAWRRDVGTLTAKWRMTNTKVDAIRSCSLYVLCTCYTQNKSKYVKCQQTQFQQDGDDVLVTGTISGDYVKAQLGVTEKAYKEDLHTDVYPDGYYTYGSDTVGIFASETHMECLVELSDEYRPPS